MKRKKNPIRFLCIALCAVLVAVMSGCGGLASVPVAAESADSIINPDRGFYFTCGAYLKRSGGSAVQKAVFDYGFSTYGLVYIWFDLTDFSSGAGGKTEALNENALELVRGTFENLRASGGGTAIVRFNYDNEGKCFGTGTDPEPDMDMIVQHVEQLGGIVKENLDVIACVQSGMFGSWGEQHSTAVSENPENYYRLVEKWREYAPGRTVSVRRPLYVLYWYNYKFNASLSLSDIGSMPDISEYRVGVYNDGYGGSESDLGTFRDRQKETEWLSRAAAGTMYGGEAVVDSVTGLTGGYNNPAFIYGEAFKTHTAYLNSEWNTALLNEWKKTAYAGADAAYAGKTAYEYIANRLGYSFLLKKASAEFKKTSVRLSLEIENKGFGNLVNAKKAYLVFLRDGEAYGQVEVPLGLTEAVSGTVKTFTVEADLPEDFNAGENDSVGIKFLDAYEKDASGAARAVRFINQGIFDKTSGANIVCRP